MKPRKNNRKSYFEEKRLQNNNPNFFKHIPPEEIRRNVKRIIRDIKYDNISENDYQYFTNSNILMACHTEALHQWQSASVVARSLNYYINNVIIMGTCPMGIDPSQELILASNEYTKYNNKASIWLGVYKMFSAIYNGAPIIKTLSNIKNMKFNINDM